MAGWCSAASMPKHLRYSDGALWTPLCGAVMFYEWLNPAHKLTLSTVGAAYLCHAWPALGTWIMKKVGPLRAAQLKSGGSGYDLKAMFFGGGRVKAD